MNVFENTHLRDVRNFRRTSVQMFFAVFKDVAYDHNFCSKCVKFDDFM